MVFSCDIRGQLIGWHVGKVKISLLEAFSRVWWRTNLFQDLVTQLFQIDPFFKGDVSGW